jgi:hypothetical protein
MLVRPFLALNTHCFNSAFMLVEVEPMFIEAPNLELLLFNQFNADLWGAGLPNLNSCKELENNNNQSDKVYCLSVPTSYFRHSLRGVNFHVLDLAITQPTAPVTRTVEVTPYLAGILFPCFKLNLFQYSQCLRTGGQV